MWTAVLKEWRASSVSRASMRVIGMVNMLFCSKQTEWFQMRLVNDKWKPTSVSSHSAWNSEMPHCRMLHCWNSAGQEQPEELMDDNLWCLYYKTPTSCSDSLKRPILALSSADAVRWRTVIEGFLVSPAVATHIFIWHLSTMPPSSLL